MPYIRNLTENTKYIFWPDFAGSHYSKNAYNSLNDQICAQIWKASKYTRTWNSLYRRFLRFNQRQSQQRSQKTWISYDTAMISHLWYLWYFIVLKSWSRVRTKFRREYLTKNRHDQEIWYCRDEIIFFFLKELEKLYYIIFI